MSVNDTSNLNDAVIGSSGPTSNKYVDVPKFRFALQKEVFRLMQLSSSQYESMLVASGKFAGAVYPGFSPHDMAAVRLIIEEAGGKITNLMGEDQRYDQEIKGAVVSNGLIHEKLLSLLKDSAST
jgi:fructose-1,6-bisphosphatase/inositol monophosphatase family enzyme